MLIERSEFALHSLDIISKVVKMDFIVLRDLDINASYIRVDIHTQVAKEDVNMTFGGGGVGVWNLDV